MNPQNVKAVEEVAETISASWQRAKSIPSTIGDWVETCQIAGLAPEPIVVEGIMTLIRHAEASRDANYLVQLTRGLRQAICRSPNDTLLWTCLIRLSSRSVNDPNALCQLVSRWNVAAGVLQTNPKPANAFAACVLLKQVCQLPPGGRRTRNDTVQFLAASNALGSIALSVETETKIAVHTVSDHDIAVTVAGSTVHYQIVNDTQRRFVDQLFSYEPGLWRWMASFGPDEVFLDVGANVGLYSIAAAGLFGVRTMAIEPFPANLHVLDLNVKANRLASTLDILPIAVSDRHTRGRLYFGTEQAGDANQRFVDDHSHDMDASARRWIEVEGWPIDTLIANRRIPFPTRIKIDVDGGEMAVVLGMRQTLADPRLKDVRMEVRWNEAAGKAVVTKMAELGFRATVHDDPKNLLFQRISE